MNTAILNLPLLLTILVLNTQKKEDMDHLIAVIREKYLIKLDMEPKQYTGIHLNFDYDKRTLVCLMGDYAKNALQELKHLTQKQQIFGPAPYIQPN